MITLFYGDNTQARDEALKALKTQFINQHGDMAVDVIDSEFTTKEDIFSAVSTVPFLAAKRLVIVRYLSSNKEISSFVDKIIELTADSTDLIFLESGLDSRSVYTKTLIAKCNDVRKFDSLDNAQLGSWICEYAKEHGGIISPANASYLVEHVGNNQIVLSSEISKMLLVNNEISRDVIDDMTIAAPASSVFAMLDALVNTNVAKASKLYSEQRQQGMEPQAILGMITWQLFIIATIFSYGAESADNIAKSSKLSPFVVRKNQLLARKLSKASIVKMFDSAIATDMSIKTNKAKPDAAVHSLLVALGSQLKSV
jgi:DNA polymerase III subunit delta